MKLAEKLFSIAFGRKSAPGTSLEVIDLTQRLEDRKHEIYDYLGRKSKKRKRKDRVSGAVYVLDFKADLYASEVQALREEIDVILEVVSPDEDEVVIRVHSAGGTVNGYGHAASQLLRLKQRKIRITACVDEIAASGGYMVASVADQILAAPFAYIGSIGVVAEFPNFHNLLGKVGVSWMELTAGESKRTVGMFTEPTPDRVNAELERLRVIHESFKQHVSSHRKEVDIESVGTGKWWLGSEAVAIGLIDRVQTSDDYLMQKAIEERRTVLSIGVSTDKKGIWRWLG